MNPKQKPPGRRGRALLPLLKDTRGASILFVLAVCLLLLAVGVSVLAAGAAAMGAGTSRELSTQLQLYNDSVHKVIKTALFDGMNDTATDIEITGFGGVESLGGMIVREAYLRAREEVPDGGLYTTLTPLEIELDIAGSMDLTSVEEIKVAIVPYVDYVPAKEPQWISYIETRPELDAGGGPVLDGDGNPVMEDVTMWRCVMERQPERATVNARVHVTVTIAYLNRRMISTADYMLTDAKLQDIALPTYPVNEEVEADTKPNDDLPGDVQMGTDASTSAGVWSFVSYTKIS
ncbi:MAG: hypothetical protein FWG93_01485 [Oscillospiraceae bacterium]|nr:hypothetical protein [Oscillospiraceae bacterium]